jgi:hypothetical protein
LLSFNFIPFIPEFLLCYVPVQNAMARYEESKSLGEAKASTRRLATRMVRSAAAPEPRDLSGGKRKDPTAVSELLERRVHEGDNTTTQPFIVVTFPIRDESLLPSRQGRPRRCYAEEERRQVADTRKRGACESCRASKTKVC